MFKGRRAWVEQTCSRWFVLSALHGLVDPKTILEPYDVTLTTASTQQKRAWSEQVLRSLQSELGPFRGLTFEIHAGADYRDFGLVRGLLKRGALIEVPMQHLSQGEQLQRYDRGPDLDSSSDQQTTAPRRPTLPEPHLRRAGGKYGRLSDYLAGLEGNSETLLFSQVEPIVGDPLVDSARRRRPWWANDVSHSQARAWLSVGWETRNVDLVATTVTFVRVRRM